MSEAKHTPGPWTVYERQAKGSTNTVWLVTRGTECYRRAGNNGTFRKSASKFRSAESAQRVADLLNEELAAAKPSSPYYREAQYDARGMKEMLPLYDLWISCANEALANGSQFTRLVWGR